MAIERVQSIWEAMVVLLREHGLILLALGSLVWQVWFLGLMVSQQQNEWRSVIGTFTSEVKEARKSHDAIDREFVSILASLQEVTRVTEGLLYAVEEACLLSREEKARRPYGGMGGMGGLPAQEHGGPQS